MDGRPIGHRSHGVAAVSPVAWASEVSDYTVGGAARSRDAAQLVIASLRRCVAGGH